MPAQFGLWCHAVTSKRNCYKWLWILLFKYMILIPLDRYSLLIQIYLSNSLYTFLKQIVDYSFQSSPELIISEVANYHGPHYGCWVENLKWKFLYGLLNKLFGRNFLCKINFFRQIDAVQSFFPHGIKSFAKKLCNIPWDKKLCTNCNFSSIWRIFPLIGKKLEFFPSIWRNLH